MFTRPLGVPDQAVIDAAAAWEVQLDRAEYLPVGFGSHHWVGHDRAGRRWFLTVDDLSAKRRSSGEPLDSVARRLAAALTAARAAADSGLAFVVAPVRTPNGDLLSPLGDQYRLAVYPHVDGRAGGYGDHPSAAERHDVMQLLVELHAVGDDVRAHALAEDFALPHRAQLEDAIRDLDQIPDSGPYAQHAHRLLADEHAGVNQLLAHYDHLVGQVRSHPNRMVLTHGEPHPANVMLTAGGPVLIDWDTALIAPPERDLWMVADRTQTALRAYERARGTSLLPEALDLYRLQWDLTEIALYTALFRAPHEDSADMAESWKNLQSYLAPRARWPDVVAAEQAPAGLRSRT